MIQIADAELPSAETEDDKALAETLQLIANTDVAQAQVSLGDHIGDGWHVVRTSFPKKVVLALAYAFHDPRRRLFVIETLYHPRKDKLSIRAVPFA